MNVSPYLYFNGTCAKAIALYETAFGVKARIMRYRDAPPSEGFVPPPGTEDYVMHACMSLGNNTEILFCDSPPDVDAAAKNGFGGSVSVMVTMDTAEQLTACFNILKEGGTVSMELQKTFWSACFGSLEDKFGVSWMFSL